MADGTLFTNPDNFRAYKVLVAAQYSKSKVRVSSEPGDFKFGETNKTDEFLKKFPLGKVPAFESVDGNNLFESNAIAYYVGNDALRGKNATDAAYVLQWINFADNEILPSMAAWVYPCMGIMQYNKQNTDHAKEDIKKALGLLNKHLETQTFLVGERISQADISVCCNLLLLYKWVLEPSFRQPYQNVNRWFTTLVNQTEFKNVIGDVQLCEKMAQFDAKKYQELFGAPKKDAKKEKKPQEPKPKQEKLKPAPAEEEEVDELHEKPAKDPFAHLPKGTMVMDDWKKMYSNNDIPTVALPYFWQNFDKENFSLWYCEYMYPEDLKLVFMSSNLVGGMFQRLDRMRKHAFGSMIVFGQNNKSTISGVWCWRGHELAFNLSPDLQVDYESYSWKKLDPDTEETKTLVKEYFSLAGDFGGKTVAATKIFK